MVEEPTLGDGATAAHTFNKRYAMKCYRFLFWSSLGEVLFAVTVRADEPRPIAPDQFDRLHRDDPRAAGRAAVLANPLEAHHRRSAAGSPRGQTDLRLGRRGAPIGVC